MVRKNFRLPLQLAIKDDLLSVRRASYFFFAVFLVDFFVAFFAVFFAAAMEMAPCL